MRDEERRTSKEMFYYLFKSTEQNAKWQEKLSDDLVSNRIKLFNSCYVYSRYVMVTVQGSVRFSHSFSFGLRIDVLHEFIYYGFILFTCYYIVITVKLYLLIHTLTYNFLQIRIYGVTIFDIIVSFFMKFGSFKLMHVPFHCALIFTFRISHIVTHVVEYTIKF
jgi:hypothetical protein